MGGGGQPLALWSWAQANRSLQAESNLLLDVWCSRDDDTLEGIHTQLASKIPLRAMIEFAVLCNSALGEEQAHLGTHPRKLESHTLVVIPRECRRAAKPSHVIRAPGDDDYSSDDTDDEDMLAGKEQRMPMSKDFSNREARDALIEERYQVLRREQPSTNYQTLYEQVRNSVDQERLGRRGGARDQASEMTH
jgi:hypothetical protein